MKAKRELFLIKEIPKQRSWIDYCEMNGQSYTGPNGDAIRRADSDCLIAMEKELESA